MQFSGKVNSKFSLKWVLWFMGWQVKQLRDPQCILSTFLVEGQIFHKLAFYNFFFYKTVFVDQQFRYPYPLLGTVRQLIIVNLILTPLSSSIMTFCWLANLMYKSLLSGMSLLSLETDRPSFASGSCSFGSGSLLEPCWTEWEWLNIKRKQLQVQSVNVYVRRGHVISLFLSHCK